MVALEAPRSVNPWTREMLARELSHSDGARLPLRTDQRLLAFCAWVVSDEPTSTRSSRLIDAGHWRRGCSASCSPTPLPRARTGQPWRCADPTNPLRL